MTAYRFNKNLIVQRLENQTVFYDGDSSVLYTLNETATYIFKKLKAKVPAEKITALLVKQYGVSEKQAQKDVDTFIGQLIDKKIISVKK